MKTPNELLKEAELEPASRRGRYGLVAKYRPVMDVLRAKGWSYRMIAQWLTERGVRTSGAYVYRLYKK